MPKGTTSKYAKKKQLQSATRTRRGATRRLTRSVAEASSKAMRPAPLRGEAAAVRQAQAVAIGASKSTAQRSRVSAVKAPIKARSSTRKKSATRRS